MWMITNELYARAQAAMAELKAAVRGVLSSAPQGGLSNAEVGRALGIYAGHVGHEGHISRTILAMLESEGVAIQNSASKRWELLAMRGEAEQGDSGERE